ncbi:MAG: DUF3800 domain-containing protein [Rhodococcus sp. (in: high G+C Gram-positive bacteria)]
MDSGRCCLSDRDSTALTPLSDQVVGPRLEFAYIDESGDTGMGTGGSTTFTLGCVLIPADDWTTRLDHIIEMRRAVRDLYRIPMRQEAKANHIVGVKKVYRDLGLGDGQMRDLYQRHLKSLITVSSGVFAISIRKDLLQKRDLDVFDRSWTYLLERLRKRSDSSGVPIVIVHDIGQNDEVRKLVRRFRRITWSAVGDRVNARHIVEDSVPRDSQQSYFIQLADLVAYAASVKVLPRNGRTAKICNDEMWDLLAPIHVDKVSQRGDGIYLFPPK